MSHGQSVRVASRVALAASLPSLGLLSGRPPGLDKGAVEHLSARSASHNYPPVWSMARWQSYLGNNLPTRP
jgi:hypothetical protein